jgi:hypothetical protein
MDRLTPGVFKGVIFRIVRLATPFDVPGLFCDLKCDAVGPEIFVLNRGVYCVLVD